MSKWQYNEWYFPTSVPKKVSGGIKAQNARKGFAAHWWGKRWIEVLESFDLGARLTRGKSYARSGQVTDLDIEQGRITARVQGSRAKPYTVSIALKTFSGTHWHKVVKRLADEPVFAAQILSNEMPKEIEDVFRSLSLSLFPERKNDLETECSCPDWSNPCKHIAAVYYLLAEAFDEFPFLLFRLRGMEMDEFLIRLRGKSTTATELKIDADPVPLPLDTTAFWRMKNEKILPGKAWEPVEEFAALPRRLGMLPFWRSEINFNDEMENLYTIAAQTMLDIVVRMEMKEPE